MQPLHHASPSPTCLFPGARSAEAAITEAEFQQVSAWIRQVAGIHLASQKKALVVGRLAARLRHHGLRSYADYLRLLRDGIAPDEAQVAIDLLTTNETQFFREPKHFDFLRQTIVPAHPAGSLLRTWSAASSTGEEAYTIAMTLSAALPHAPWEVFASDLSSRVLERARAGHYPLSRAKDIPASFLRACCLRGIGRQQGTFLIDPRLRARVRFAQVNLVEPLPEIGEFDVIFLRNVMIYFDMSTKRAVVAGVLGRLCRGGWLIVGHSESLNGVTDAVRAVAPSIYRKS